MYDEFTVERQGCKQIPFVGSHAPGRTKDTFSKIMFVFLALQPIVGVFSQPGSGL
jgi:hypothetical protein